jgi:hypothetical protein
MGIPGALLAGCTLIAASIVAHGFLPTASRFAVANVAPGVIARMDSRTGVLEFCGDLEHLEGVVLPIRGNTVALNESGCVVPK